MKAIVMLKELIAKHPEWDWDTLDGEGFFNLMSAYRNAPVNDQRTQQLAYDAIKAFVYQLEDKKEKRLMQVLIPRDIALKRKEFEAGMIAFSKEVQILIKERKTKTEKAYLDLAKELEANIPTVFLIWQFINGYKKSKQDIINWATKQSLIAQGFKKSYYNWIIGLVTTMSEETFNKFKISQQVEINIADDISILDVGSKLPA
jgi:hypothetical protein